MKKFNIEPIYDHEQKIAEANKNLESFAMEDKLIKIQTVMDYVQLSKTKIYDYIKEGKFPQSHKVGGSSLWFMSDIQNYILEQKKSKNKVA